MDKEEFQVDIISGMKVAVLSCFDMYELRTKYVKNFFQEKGAVCKIITSDFDHIKRKYDEARKENCEYIHAKSYSKNISVARLRAHYMWAKAAVNSLITFEPDLIYCLVPPNSLAKFAIKYAKKNGCKVIFDIIDMWPESMPIPKLLKKIAFLPIGMWRNMRQKNIERANAICLECELYRSVLDLKNKNVHTLSLTGEDIRGDRGYVAHDKLTFCYLGSINNIIDIDIITELLGEINRTKSCKLIIIGKGEKEKELVDRVESVGVEVEKMGAIFDATIKQEVMNHCDYALNIMKSSVATVGLTMKSMDYMRFGLPLVNTIKGDTTHYVEKYQCGININNISVTDIAKQILDTSSEKMLEMRENVVKCYVENLTKECFDKNFGEVIKSIL